MCITMVIQVTFSVVWLMRDRVSETADLLREWSEKEKLPSEMQYQLRFVKCHSQCFQQDIVPCHRAKIKLFLASSLYLNGFHNTIKHLFDVVGDCKIFLSRKTCKWTRMIK